MTAKLALARWIVARSHGEDAARAADHFTRVVREGRAPADVPERRRCRPVTRCIFRRSWPSASGSRRATRRLLAQGGVKVDGQVVGDLDLPRATLTGALIQAGKHFVLCGLRAEHDPRNGDDRYRRSVLTSPGRPKGGASILSLDELERLRANPYDQCGTAPRPLSRVRGFVATSKAARSLRKLNSVTSRPLVACLRSRRPAGVRHRSR